MIYDFTRSLTFVSSKVAMLAYFLHAYSYEKHKSHTDVRLNATATSRLETRRG